MPTTSMTLTREPADLTSGLLLSRGVSYALQAGGNHPALLHWGDTRPTATPSPPVTLLAEQDILQITVGGERIWAWTYGASTVVSASPQTIYLGPPRDAETVDLSGGDYVRERGFVLQVNAAGDVSYTTLDGGSTSRTETFAAAGYVGVAGVPLALRAVRQAGTSSGLSLTAGLL